MNPSSGDYPAHLEAWRPLSPSVDELTLALELPGFRWKAGQYLHLGREATGSEKPYSIASAPHPALPQRVQLAVSRSESEEAEPPPWRVGERFRLRGPSGRFVRDAFEDRGAILVGTGTGVAPLRAMVQAEAERASGAELVLIAGFRNEAESLWHEEFAALAERLPRFHYLPTLSAGSPEWRGKRGYVQSHLVEVLDAFAPAPLFLCGRRAMIEACKVLLHTRASTLPPEWIITEG